MKIPINALVFDLHSGGRGVNRLWVTVMSIHAFERPPSVAMDEMRNTRHAG